MRRDVITVRGADAATYLHGQLSQDITGMAVGEKRWSFILQPMGKVEALVRVHRTEPDGFELDVDAGHGAAVLARVRRFRRDRRPLHHQGVLARP